LREWTTGDIVQELLLLEQISNRGMTDICARVAQLDRVAASEAEGCGFNSRRAHQFLHSIPWPAI
jgi:hypothetical protein